MKLDLKDDQVKSFRAQLQSHTLTLQMFLQMINLRVSSVGPTIILDEVIPRLEMLAKSIQLLEEKQRQLQEPETSTKSVMDEQETVILESNDRLLHSANELLTEVSSVIEEIDR